MTVQAEHQAVDSPPRWFDLLAVSGAALVAAVGAVGLLLAVVGAYRTWLALLVGLPVAAGLVWMVRRSLPATPRTSRTPWSDLRTIGAAAAVLLAAGYVLFAGSYPSQNVIASRDPGLYLNTARWLSREGDLTADARGEAFEGIDGLLFGGAGVYDVDDGRVEFQFNHLASTVLAVGHDLGGYRLMFRMPALVAGAGLLAVYAVAVRLTRRPLLALVAPGLLAVSMPLLFTARNTYSEPFAFVLLWGAAMLLADLHRRPRAGAALTAGALLGALVATRVDALLYVILVVPLAALSIAARDDADPESRATRRLRAGAWGAVLGAAALVSVVGVVDLLVWTGNYASDLSPELNLLRLALVAAVLASAVGLFVVTRAPRSWPGLLDRYEAGRGRLAIAAAALVLLALGALWLLRPQLQIVHGDYAFEGVRNIQKASGMEIDPSRTYAEDSMRWMQWYLGVPALLAAFGGLALAAHRSVRRPARPVELGVLVLTLAAGGLYWWKPSITPDHLWATRRFVPAVFPALAVMAAFGLAALVGLIARRTPRLDQRLRLALAAALVLVVVVPPAVTTWPLRWQRAQYGYLNPLLEACAALPEDAAVIMLGGYPSVTLPHAVRSWCGVPVAGQGDLNADNFLRYAEQVAANGYRPHLLTTDLTSIDGYAEAAGRQPHRTNAAADHHLVEATLDRAPDRYAEPRRALPVETPFRLYLVEVPVP